MHRLSYTAPSMGVTADSHRYEIFLFQDGSRSWALRFNADLTRLRRSMRAISAIAILSFESEASNLIKSIPGAIICPRNPA
jgi:hypothetical protein